VSVTLHCAECGRPWLDPNERWHGALAVGDEADEDAREVVVFCPDCAEGELGA
jgi:hypothetical protein